jgi:hypothetical protein
MLTTRRLRAAAPATVVTRVVVHHTPAEHPEGPCYQPPCRACSYWRRLVGKLEDRRIAAVDRLFEIEQRR